MDRSYAQKILDKTSDGHDVFAKFFGKQCDKRLFRNIYRNDARPSCTLYEKQGRWRMIDYGNSDWSGDCFHVVAMIQNLNLNVQFMQVLRVIDKECSLGIIPGEYEYQSLRKEGIDGDIKTTSKIISFKPVFKGFSINEKSYWEKYGITKEVLEAYHVRSLASCTYLKEDNTSYTIYSNSHYPFFGYTFLNKDNQVAGIKSYRPGSNQRFLRVGIIPSPYIFGIQNLPDKGQTLFVTGGEKDALSLASHGFHAICLNSESSIIPRKEFANLLERFEDIVILYDMDTAGRHYSQLRFKECENFFGPLIHKVRIGNLPLSGNKSDKDVSDYFARGNNSSDFLHDLSFTQNDFSN